MNTRDTHVLTEEEELARAYIAQNPGTTIEEVIVYLMQGSETDMLQGYETDPRRIEISNAVAYVAREYCYEDPKTGTLKLIK